MDMYHRECERRNNGLARMIPHLREVHVLRDAWMKLNVHPAKIMQVCFTTVSCINYCACTNDSGLLLELLQSSCETWWSFIRNGLMIFIMQQQQVLTELHSYVTQNPPPTDAPSACCTLKYLTSCNLFEQGLLSHDRVHAKDIKVIENVRKGYSFSD